MLGACRNHSGQKGQAFLIVVLIMVIALTVGLSVASRTVTNLKLSTEESNSQKAFSAAEAGIEQYLQSPISNPTINTNFQTTNGSTILSLTRTYIGGGQRDTLLENGNAVTKDDGADIWFTQYDSNPANLYTSNWNNGASNGIFTVYWGNSGTAVCSDAAIELLVITGTGKTDPNLKIARYPIENGCSNGRSVGFAVGTPTSTTYQGITFPYKYTFNNLNNIVYARVIPLFANTKVWVNISAGPAFPARGQGQLIISSGQSGSAQRQLSYFESWDTIPSELLYSVLSSQ